ncbi:hypothetical protein MnTg04_00019 [bacterium MnTg04]|nr:hypothetical protein MnTg04_00019 [bacterium MnTg04]
MNAMRLTLALLLLSTFVLTAHSHQVDEQVPSAAVACVSTGQNDSHVVTDAARTDLDRLVSTDAEVRRKALAELALEIYSGTPQSEGKYSNYGDTIFPYLLQVIDDLDDPFSHYAVEAIFWLGTYNQIRVELDSSELDDIGKREVNQQLEEIDHYPIPSDYAPLKEALVNALRHSEDNRARYWAAQALVDGFEPVSEIERVLVTQFPLEEANWRVQSAIMGSLSEIADRNEIERATELTIIEALASPNLKTRETAVRIVRTHQFDGGLERLIESIPAASDAIELRQLLSSIFSFSKIYDVHIVELEKAAANTDDEERKKEIRSTIEQIRYASTDTIHHFGLVELTQSSIILHTAHRGLRPGTPIAVIGSDIDLYVAARVDAKLQKVADTSISSHPVVAYYVGMRAHTLLPELIENAVVYFSPDSLAFPVSSLVHSSCTSNEGIHHTVWSTGDSGRIRVWSAYQHLGYGVEPSCSDDDLAE